VIFGRRSFSQCLGVGSAGRRYPGVWLGVVITRESKTWVAAVTRAAGRLLRLLEGLRSLRCFRIRKELVSKMKTFRLMGVVLLAVFAVGAVAASAAQAATEAPYWSIQGTRLASGATHFISAKVLEGEFKLVDKLGGVTVSCKTAGFPLAGGVLLGSNAEEPGTNNETVEFTGCKSTITGTNCTEVTSKELKTLGTIITNALKSELVEDKEGNLYVELAPIVTAGGFVTLEFFEAGSVNCNKNAKVEGSVAAEVLTDPGKEKVSLTKKAASAESWLLNFPATPIKKVVLYEKGSAPKEVSVGLKTLGSEAIEEGIALILLAEVKGGKLVSTKELWSPLP